MSRTTRVASNRSRVSVEIQRATRRRIPPRASFERWARAALNAQRAELAIRVVDDDESAALNRKYRKKSGPTNVLSFPSDALAKRATRTLGDLVICAPCVAREARAQHKTQTAHWAHLTVHGTLHLRGYDHENDSDARAMEALEKKILKRLGFPDPYRDDELKE